MSQVEVIIPALNEEATIRHIVTSCLRAPSISVVHVMVDAKTTDHTAEQADIAGALVNISHGQSGKGQLIDYVCQVVQTDRVMLCDADYTRFSWYLAELAAGAHTDSMRIMVPRMPTPAQWKIGGAPFAFNSYAWGLNSGLRSFPTWLLNDMEKSLHGYLVETQLNQEAEAHNVRLERLYEPSLIQPLRFSERRLQAMEEDRAWGIANGVLRG